jgi:pantoate kinase
MMVTGTFGSVLTKHVLLSPEKRAKINRSGRKTLQAILDEPSLENFLASCLKFAEETGFMTPRTKKLAKLAEKAGAIGAAQNMVGEAVHALASEKKAEDIAEAFEQMLPKKRILVSKIDFQGARLVKE